MLLLANMNYTMQQKAPIVQRLIQIGIDVYGAAITAAPASSTGLVWSSNGGHNHGRKMPMLFAGLLLHDQSMIQLAGHANHTLFQEDSQFFYISARDVSIAHGACCNRPVEDYRTADLGLPEWGLDHLGHPQNDNRLWRASYRDIVGSSLLPHVLAAKLMGATEYWNHSALFDYFDQRFYPAERARAGAVNGIEVYVRDLWDAYHDTPAPGPVAPRSLRLVQ
jgi:hypothetical protein